MANFAYTTLNITTTTLLDAVNDSKFGQIQSITYTINPNNIVLSIGNASTDDLGIFNEGSSQNTSTQPAVLSGRRPQTGQLYPRGVYNR